MRIFQKMVAPTLLSLALVSAEGLLASPGRNPSSLVYKEASHGLELRSRRRVGVGAVVAGPLGAGGLGLELNVSPRTSVVLGYGGGRPFQSFTFQVKRSLAGRYFIPYLAGGYARWYGNATSAAAFSDTYPAILGERFLAKDAQVSGKFSQDIIYPAFGIQYLQLDGPWAGLSFHLEGVVLVDLLDLVAAPTASLGMLYYF
jgi:hypothetical protein